MLGARETCQTPEFTGRCARAKWTFPNRGRHVGRAFQPDARPLVSGWKARPTSAPRNHATSFSDGAGSANIHLRSRRPVDNGSLESKTIILNLEMSLRVSKRWKDCCVRPASRVGPLAEPGRLIVAAGLLVVLLAAHDVSASSVSSPTAELTAPAHDCKCATRCRGASCCCGPHTSLARRAGCRACTAESAGAFASPCQLRSAPCGHSGLPSRPAEFVTSESAVLETTGSLRLDTTGSFIPSSALSLIPGRRASRLDRPPEPQIPRLIPTRPSRCSRDRCSFALIVRTNAVQTSSLS